MKALLIIDMQNDFMPGGPLGIDQADEIIPVINRLIDLFDNVYATKDWHPKNHVSFAAMHDKKINEEILINQNIQRLWPDHCIQNTEGAKIVPNIRADKIEKIFYKGSDESVDSYSAFFDNNHERSTGLDLFLKERNIEDLYMVGVATDYCVKFSALDAHRLGFNVFIVKDACMPVDKTGEKQVLLELEKKGIHLVSSEDLF